MRKRQRKKLGKKINYATGLTGYGPTLLDIRPKVGVLSDKEKRKAQPIIDELSKIKQQCFKDACIEVLGENPDEWE